MKHWGRWLLFEQLLFVPKHVTLSEKMRLAWLVSIPASCFFDQHEGRYLRISELRLEDLKTVTFYFWTLREDHTPHKVTFTYLLEPFSSLLHVWLCRHQLSYCHACRGQTRQFQLVPVRSPRLLDKVFVLIHPLNWKSPHHARKGKEPGGMPYWKTRDMLQPSFSKAKCELLRPGQSGMLRISPSGKKSLEFPYRNRVTMQARSGELWWSTDADDSYSSIFCLFQSMCHCRRRCVLRG